jgi:photosystem II stability/assembly factor-like uncharacterized protein
MMHRPQRNVLFILIVVFLASSFPIRFVVAEQRSDRLPFLLTWTKITCSGCKTSDWLDKLQFTSPLEAWAVGELPPGGQGASSYSLVHSHDGGRSWQEIPDFGGYNAEPVFSFSGPQNGWVIQPQIPEAEITVMHTNDGGSNWQTLFKDELGHFNSIHFFSDRLGYAVGATSLTAIIEGRTDSNFYRTLDGGNTWKSAPLPSVGYISQMVFLTPDVGWIAGAEGPVGGLRTAAVLTTTDGGNHWERSVVETSRDVAEISDLSFSSASRGWLTAWNYNFEGTSLFSTTDGGKSWTMDVDNSFHGPGKWLNTVRFVGETLGFAFGRGRSPYLAYSIDGGAHWRKMAIPHFVNNCQTFLEALRCTATDLKSGLWMLTVRPALAH